MLHLETAEELLNASLSSLFTPFSCLFLFDSEVLNLNSVMGNVHLKKERKKTPTKQENALNPAVLALQFNRAPALFR